MADEKVTIELLIETAKGANNLEDMRAGVDALREEIAGVDVGSEAFNKLAGAIQQGESRLKTLEKTFEGLEPQQIADSFVKVGEAVAGGFAAAQGAALLLGDENEDLQESIVKAQAAVSIAVGARAAAEGILQGRIAARFAIEKISNALTASSIPVFQALNKVLLANPIGLVVAALGALATAIGAIIILTNDSRDAEELLNEARNQAVGAIAEERAQLDTLVKTAQNEQLSKEQRQEAIEAINEISPEYLGNINEENISTQAVADAIDKYNELIEKKATLDAIAAIKTELLEQQIQAQLDAQTGANVGFLDYATSLQTGIDASEIANAETANLIVTQNEELAILDDLTQQLNLEVDALETGNDAIRTRATLSDERIKKSQEVDKEVEKRHQEQLKRLEQTAQANQDLQDQVRQIEINAIEDEEQRALQQLEFDLELDRRKIEQSVASQDEKDALLLAKQEEFERASDQIQADFQAQRDAKAEEERLAREEQEALEAEARQQQIDEQLAKDLEANQIRIDNEKRVAQAKLEAIKGTTDNIIGFGQQLAEATGKQAEFQKAVALGEIAVDTARAIASLTANSEANPANAVTFGGAGILQFVSGIARIGANIAKARNLLTSKNPSVPSAGGAGGAGGGGIAGASAGIAAGETPVTTITGAGEGAEQPETQTPAVKAVVVETDISTTQKDINSIEESATIS